MNVMAEPLGERECDQFYRIAMLRLQKENIPFLVGGAYAFGEYTGICRDTKDFDLCIHPQDVDRVLATLRDGGYETEKIFPHWLAKAKCKDDVIDLIYRAGNGLCEVDSSWFARAHDGELLNVPVKLCAPEELLWMKAFIMERERYDGADIIHLIESCGENMDWDHLVQRFGPDWPVLLSHLILFGYVFPSERDQVPDRVVDLLVARLQKEPLDKTSRICRGTLLSRQQYHRDIHERGLRDARLDERVKMDGVDIARWTDAIKRDGSPEQ
jgi:hypothetical protein